jgi:hypothetical protein
MTEPDLRPGTEAVVNKTMDRDDLLSPEGSEFVRELNSLAEELDRHRLSVTSWYGVLA